MEHEEAFPITYGVLGLLAFSGPMSGYDLKQAFDVALMPMWNATHSQIYNELRRMANLGWVTMERQTQDTRPDRKVYTVNPAGKAALHHWQTMQPVRGLQMRDEVLLRFVFGAFADPRALATTLRAAIADHEQRIATYRANQTCLPATPALNGPATQSSPAEAPDPFFNEMARFGLLFEEMYLRWLHEALAFVEARNDPRSPGTYERGCGRKDSL